ncbi:MAG: DUF3955 domain-containing protein [Candidatus Hydrothermarchaeales archaeon]
MFENFSESSVDSQKFLKKPLFFLTTTATLCMEINPIRLHHILRPQPIQKGTLSR